MIIELMPTTMDLVFGPDGYLMGYVVSDEARSVTENKRRSWDVEIMLNNFSTQIVGVRRTNTRWYVL